MSITSEPTLSQALALARRLSWQDRAALIARLAQKLADGRNDTPGPAEPLITLDLRVPDLLQIGIFIRTANSNQS